LGGEFRLTFDYDADGPGSAPAKPHHDDGPIFGLELGQNVISPTYIDTFGPALLIIDDLNLAGSGVGPDGGGLRTLLLPGFPLNDQPLKLQCGLLVDAEGVPEPGSAQVIGVGLVAALRRRRPQETGLWCVGVRQAAPRGARACCYFRAPGVLHTASAKSRGRLPGPGVWCLSPSPGGRSSTATPRAAGA
jgi:hypothetical protein